MQRLVVVEVQAGDALPVLCPLFGHFPRARLRDVLLAFVAI